MTSSTRSCGPRGGTATGTRTGTGTGTGTGTCGVNDSRIATDARPEPPPTRVPRPYAGPHLIKPNDPPHIFRATDSFKTGPFPMLLSGLALPLPSRLFTQFSHVITCWCECVRCCVSESVSESPYVRSSIDLSCVTDNGLKHEHYRCDPVAVRRLGRGWARNAPTHTHSTHETSSTLTHTLTHETNSARPSRPQGSPQRRLQTQPQQTATSAAARASGGQGDRAACSH